VELDIGPQVVDVGGTVVQNSAVVNGRDVGGQDGDELRSGGPVIEQKGLVHVLHDLSTSGLIADGGVQALRVSLDGSHQEGVRVVAGRGSSGSGVGLVVW
jgi:hypothetical protein